MGHRGALHPPSELLQLLIEVGRRHGSIWSAGAAPSRPRAASPARALCRGCHLSLVVFSRPEAGQPAGCCKSRSHRSPRRLYILPMKLKTRARILPLLQCEDLDVQDTTNSEYVRIYRGDVALSNMRFDCRLCAAFRKRQKTGTAITADDRLAQSARNTGTGGENLKPLNPTQGFCNPLLHARQYSTTTYSTVIVRPSVHSARASSPPAASKNSIGFVTYDYGFTGFSHLVWVQAGFGFYDLSIRNQNVTANVYKTCRL